MKRKFIKITKNLALVLFVVMVLVSVILLDLFLKQDSLNEEINDNYETIINDKNYEQPVNVKGIEIVTQKVNCGYACIEMIGKWLGKEITEDSLLKKNNGEITTTLGSGFKEELQEQFPEYEIVTYTNETNSEMLDKIYNSLKSGMPVCVELAAYNKNNSEENWEMHYAIVIGMDFKNNKVTVLNPFGYEEVYKIDEFLKSTRFDSFKNMSLLKKIAFAGGMYTKNTIYIIEEE